MRAASIARPMPGDRRPAAAEGETDARRGLPPAACAASPASSRPCGRGPVPACAAGCEELTFPRWCARWRTARACRGKERISFCTARKVQPTRRPRAGDVSLVERELDRGPARLMSRRRRCCPGPAASMPARRICDLHLHLPPARAVGMRRCGFRRAPRRRTIRRIAPLRAVPLHADGRGERQPPAARGPPARHRRKLLLDDGKPNDSDHSIASTPWRIRAWALGSAARGEGVRHHRGPRGARLFPLHLRARRLCDLPGHLAPSRRAAGDLPAGDGLTSPDAGRGIRGGRPAVRPAQISAANGFISQKAGRHGRRQRNPPRGRAARGGRRRPMPRDRRAASPMLPHPAKRVGRSCAVPRPRRSRSAGAGWRAPSPRCPSRR